jgi:biotin carboxyl carrier protein
VIVEIESAGTTRRVELVAVDDGWTVKLDGGSVQATMVRAGQRWSLLITENGGAARSYDVAIAEQGTGRLAVHVDGQATLLAVRDPRALVRYGRMQGRDGRDGEYDGPHHVRAPMPGRIVKLLVGAGETVAARQGVVIVEAMKMENELRAPKAGTVTAVHVAEGATVEADATLMTID